MKRPTRPKGSAVDAIQILAILEKPSGPELLLEKQFRPPTGKVVIELPAGMVDQGETPEQAAVRELKEETGYVGEVVEEASGERPVHWNCKYPLPLHNTSIILTGLKLRHRLGTCFLSVMPICFIHR